MSEEIRCIQAGYCDLCDKIMKFGHVELDDKVYCLLHAPKLETDKQKNNYNELIYKLITGDSRNLPVHIYDIDLSDIVFTQPITILYDGLKVKRSLKFFNCIFLEEVTLVGIEFDEVVSFQESIFKKKVIINKCKFNGTDNKHAKLCINFNECKFEDSLWFLDNTIKETFSFGNVIIEKKSLIMDNSFRKKAYFNGCSFFDYIDFGESEFYDEVEFNSSEFQGKTYFALKKNAKKDTMFNKKVDFSYCEFNNVKFASQSSDKRIFCGEAYFQDVDVNSKLIFENVDTSKISLKNTLIKNIRISNIEKLKKLYDEELLPSSEIAELYRQLKQKYIDEGNYSEAGKWHLKEKEFQQKTEKWYSIPFYKLYKWSSGFGENWFQSIIVFLTIFTLSILTIFIYANLKFDPNGWSLFKESFSHTLNIILTNDQDSIKAMGLDNNFSALIFITFTRIVLLIQFWLMSLAMRNYFRR
ncbi:MAG: hypothetical protein PHR06_05335 [Candidatus Cloacimonetes bacterium]|nr:hypothetical protein [Candidatus Cloacimonadota bacterium]